MTAANHNPIYAGPPKTAYCSVTTGTGILATDFDDIPTGTVLLMTAPAGGARVEKVTAFVVDPAITAAMGHYLYLSKDGGVTKRMINSKVHAAYTYAVTTVQAADDFGYTAALGLFLEEGDSLYAQSRHASAVTDGVKFVATYRTLVPDAA